MKLKLGRVHNDLFSLNLIILLSLFNSRVCVYEKEKDVQTRSNENEVYFLDEEEAQGNSEVKQPASGQAGL